MDIQVERKRGGRGENPPKKWRWKVRQMKDGIRDWFRRNINSNRKKYEYPMCHKCMLSRTGQLQFKKLNFTHAKIRNYVKHSVLNSHLKKLSKHAPTYRIHVLNILGTGTCYCFVLKYRVEIMCLKIKYYRFSN